MKNYKVKLINSKDKIEQSFECSDDQIILEAAEQNNIELPYSCRIGSCSSCLGKVLSGNINQNNQKFLDEKDLLKNFVLLCVAIPTSDTIISTYEEDNLY